MTNKKDARRRDKGRKTHLEVKARILREWDAITRQVLDGLDGRDIAIVKEGR